MDRPAPAEHNPFREQGGSTIAAHFTWLDWLVMVGYLTLTTLLGAKLAGRQSTIRDFFLAGRRLPWYAVAGSIVATEISAVTFISVPAIVFAPGGDLTYLQLALGAVLARIVIAVWFVPAFYEREIYSPYDYVGLRLGPPARAVTTGLFALGAILGQSARVLLTALILQEIAGLSLGASIWIIGAVAVGWTLMGGITTVIWTDVIQFFVFSLALVAAVVLVLVKLPGSPVESLADVFALAAADDHAHPAGKLRLWNLSTDPNVAFTLWAALFGNTLLCLNAYGTDQMIAQRMFCCRSARQASVAMVASSVSILITLLAMLVGLALYAFYQHQPLDPLDAVRVAVDKDRIFPIFIVREIPSGLTGLIIAGVFAAAISSLDSVLAALSQVVVTGVWRPWRERRGVRADGTRDRAELLVSKLLVIVWAVLLCAMAHAADRARERYGDILNLALAMATYTGGAMLAAFMLALLRLNVDHRGIVWSAALSVLTVFSVSWHQAWAQRISAALAALIVGGWLVALFVERRGAARSRRREADSPSARADDVVAPAGVGVARGAQDRAPAPWRADAAATALLVAGAALAVWLCVHRDADTGRHVTVAWPWNVPIGFVVAFGFGWLLARPARRPASQGQR